MLEEKEFFEKFDDFKRKVNYCEIIFKNPYTTDFYKSKILSILNTLEIPIKNFQEQLALNSQVQQDVK